MSDQGDRQGHSLGPIIGFRRPNYGVLDSALAPFVAASFPEGVDADFYLLVNLGHTLRQVYSKYALERATSGELARYPYYLAAELLTLGGHYRNYLWSRHGVRSTVVMYHSTRRCPEKVLATGGRYKEKFYGDRMDPTQSDLETMRRYVAANLLAAKETAEFIPHMHVVDTGELDPEAWPWQAMAEGQVQGPALVMSGWDCDLQYALAGNGGRPVGVLRASGAHTDVVTRGSLIRAALEGVKTAAGAETQLEPGHFLYLLALAGEKGLGVEAVRGMGMGRAYKALLGQVQRGRCVGEDPSLTALLQDSFLKAENEADVRASWEALVHRDYCARWATATRMAEVTAQLTNREEPGSLQKANSRFFGRTPFDIRMATAGESSQ